MKHQRPSLDPDTKKKIKKWALDLRDLLEADIAKQLKRLGIEQGQPFRDTKAPAYLTEAERAARAVIIATIRKETKNEGSLDAAIQAYMREAAYTWLNRLVGLKCMEARGLLFVDGEATEVITTRPEYQNRSRLLWALRETNQETFVPVPESGGGLLITTGPLGPGSVYTIGTDLKDRKLALFLIQAQANKGSGRLIPLGNLSTAMKEGIKMADAYLKANLKNLGIDRDLKQYDFSLQALNLTQAKEGAETAVAFFIALVSALLERPVKEQLVVLGEMSVQGLLLKVSNLTERMQLALDSGAKRILIPSENKRDLGDVPDELLNKIQPIFYTDPINAAIRAMGLE